VRLAVVTGASSGIGEATARLLAREGWRVILVARRAGRLEALAAALPGSVPLALDLTAPDAPARVREAVEREGPLELLVSNAGAGWRAPFREGGYANVRSTMDLNFDAVVRLAEALLPLLREAAPSSMVNVGSIAGRVGRPNVAAYAASKFALAGWTEGLAAEEAAHGVHVGLVLPGFAATEGFPQEHLLRSATTRWMVSTPEKVARAILAAGPGGRSEVYVPRAWGLVPVARSLAPAIVRRVVKSGRF
jgi:short-subunit dehydrogenase